MGWYLAQQKRYPPVSANIKNADYAYWQISGKYCLPDTGGHWMCDVRCCRICVLISDSIRHDQKVSVIDRQIQP